MVLDRINQVLMDEKENNLDHIPNTLQDLTQIRTEYKYKNVELYKMAIFIVFKINWFFK